MRINSTTKFIGIVYIKIIALIVFFIFGINLSSCKKQSLQPETKNIIEKTTQFDPKNTIPLKPSRDPGTVEVQHILISYKDNEGRVKPLENRTKKQAEKLAVDLLSRARNGEDFNKLVTKFSDDPNKMHHNLYPGYYEIPFNGRKNFNKDFVDCSIGMSPGNINLVETPFGYHIILRRK